MPGFSELFSLFSHRWLEVQVANLTCPQRWVQYLRLLRESIWPGGVLPKYPRPGRTQAQKAATEKQALQSLMSILPGNGTSEMVILVMYILSSHPPLPVLPDILPHLQKAQSPISPTDGKMVTAVILPSLTQWWQGSRRITLATDTKGQSCRHVSLKLWGRFEKAVTATAAVSTTWQCCISANWWCLGTWEEHDVSYSTHTWLISSLAIERTQPEKGFSFSCVVFQYQRKQFVACGCGNQGRVMNWALDNPLELPFLQPQRWTQNYLCTFVAGCKALLWLILSYRFLKNIFFMTFLCSMVFSFASVP